MLCKLESIAFVHYTDARWVTMFQALCGVNGERESEELVLVLPEQDISGTYALEIEALSRWLFGWRNKNKISGSRIKTEIAFTHLWPRDFVLFLIVCRSFSVYNHLLYYKVVSVPSTQWVCTVPVSSLVTLQPLVLRSYTFWQGVSELWEEGKDQWDLH